MTYLQAAIAVLNDAATPMTAQQIVAEAVARGLLSPRGKTPEATMAATLYCYIRDAPEPVIQRVARQGRTRALRGSVAWSTR